MALLPATADKRAGHGQDIGISNQGLHCTALHAAACGLFTYYFMPWQCTWYSCVDTCQLFQLRQIAVQAVYECIEGGLQAMGRGRKRQL
jgi:hypothetical protein